LLWKVIEDRGYSGCEVIFAVVLDKALVRAHNLLQVMNVCIV